jgi:hypothetical protein
MRRPLLFLALLLFADGCGVRNLPPPAPPAEEVPDVPDIPNAPPEQGHGRLFIDANGETAKVSRIVGSASPSESERPPTNKRSLTMLFEGGAGVGHERLSTQLLCIAPCVIDLPRQGHTLLFTSPSDPTKTSVADVTVEEGTSVFRHSMGHRRHASTVTQAGRAMLLAGIGVTLLGAAWTTLTALRTPQYDAAGRVTNDGTSGIVSGLVAAGIGLAVGITGGVLATVYRPEVQPGATTQFRLP